MPCRATPPGTLGVGDLAQALPFQCQISAADTGVVPAAQAYLAVAVTEEKPPTTGFGVVTVAQALPFQCISSVCSARSRNRCSRPPRRCVAETAAIALSEPATGVNPGALAQALPFQCRIRVLVCPKVPV